MAGPFVTTNVAQVNMQVLWTYGIVDKAILWIDNLFSAGISTHIGHLIDDVWPTNDILHMRTEWWAPPVPPFGSIHIWLLAGFVTGQGLTIDMVAVC